MIPYGHQSIDEDDIAAVVEVLRGDWLTQGPHVTAFEEALAAKVEARFAVAFSSGTAALYAAATAADLGPGDLVATTSLSFVASASCARFAGADVAFVDIDPSTRNLDVSAVPPEATGVVAVHFAGLPVDLSRLPHRPRVVIEDAAHALGAHTPDGPVGNCARSDLCVFSFHPVKTITTGEGGAVTTNSAELAERLRRFRHHRIVPRPELGAWCYDVEAIGHNFRLTDIQAALGTSQLRKLERFVQARNALAARYAEQLADADLELPPTATEGFGHAWHLFAVRVADRRRVFDGMRAAGIGVQVHYVPIHRHSAYAGLGLAEGALPATDRVADELLSLPLYPDLTEGDQDRVVTTLRRLLSGT